MDAQNYKKLSPKAFDFWEVQYHCHVKQTRDNDTAECTASAVVGILRATGRINYIH